MMPLGKVQIELEESTLTPSKLPKATRNIAPKMGPKTGQPLSLLEYDSGDCPDSPSQWGNTTGECEEYLRDVLVSLFTSVGQGSDQYKVMKYLVFIV
ncbi:hypothetical protein ETB97_010966 [Aspergillus alliaceus]|uniref:Uncharacterized protein n=1 Tax=Petromyces alliaceus TaxID=209559 RepID=A0A8H6AAU2_PETAA|nr:hypothetical protein ETB97_010966 [Aspergillus burnettii]